MSEGTIYSKTGYGADCDSAFLDVRESDLVFGSKTQVVRVYPGRTGEKPLEYITRVLNKDPRFQPSAPCACVVKGSSNGKWIFYCKIKE